MFIDGTLAELHAVDRAGADRNADQGHAQAFEVASPRDAFAHETSEALAFGLTRLGFDHELEHLVDGGEDLPLRRGLACDRDRAKRSQGFARAPSNRASAPILRQLVYGHLAVRTHMDLVGDAFEMLVSEHLGIA